MGRCMGGVMWLWCVGVGGSMLPGVVRLELGVGGSLDGNGVEVVGVVSYGMENTLGSLFNSSNYLENFKLEPLNQCHV